MSQVMETFQARMSEIDRIHCICDYRFNTYRRDLKVQGWTDLQLLNLGQWSNDRDVTIYYGQKTADLNCGGCIDTYISISAQYRKLDFERFDVYKHMTRRNAKRFDKAIKATYLAMEKEFIDGFLG
jgi:hypothetical protein